VNNCKEILSKTVSDKFSEQAAQSKTSFDNLNNSLKENIAQINQRQDKQGKEIKLLKMIAIAITIISVLGTIVTILVLKKP
jgi:serine/threonine protein phosphatase PrpC